MYRFSICKTRLCRRCLESDRILPQRIRIQNDTNRNERRKYSDQFPCRSASNVRHERLGLFSVVHFCSRAKNCVGCHVQCTEAFERKMQFSLFHCSRMVFCSTCFLILILCFAGGFRQSVFVCFSIQQHFAV